MPEVTGNKNEDLEIKQLSGINILHNAHEFLLTLRQEIPVLDKDGEINQIHKKTIARYTINPAFAKMMLNVLANNIQKYEEKYGEIATNIPEGLN